MGGEHHPPTHKPLLVLRCRHQPRANPNGKGPNVPVSFRDYPPPLIPKLCHPDPERSRRGRICFPPQRHNLRVAHSCALFAHGWGTTTVHSHAVALAFLSVILAGICFWFAFTVRISSGLQPTDSATPNRGLSCGVSSARTYLPHMPTADKTGGQNETRDRAASIWVGILMLFTWLSGCTNTPWASQNDAKLRPTGLTKYVVVPNGSVKKLRLICFFNSIPRGSINREENVEMTSW
jgi:hypothetical protein